MRGSLFWIGLAAILGGIVHIAAMLVIPLLAPKSGYSRFESTIEENRAVVFGPAAPGAEPFPYSSPDQVYVICRFNVADNPLRFTASLPDTYWSLGLYEPDGGNVFHTNSMQAPTGQPDLVVRTRGQELDTVADRTVADVTVPRGLAILRVFLRDHSMEAMVRQAAGGSSCVPFNAS